MRYHGFNRTHADPAQDGPLTVALYAGPGTGKSTTAAEVFAILKHQGRNVEMVHEVAKDLVWEQRHKALGHQPYLLAKQMFHWDRLNGEVDAIITDTSTLLGLLYGDPKTITPAFYDWIVDDYRRRRTINVFLERNPSRAYNPKGRTQTESQAVAADCQVLTMLRTLRIDHWTVQVSDTCASQIAEKVVQRMNWLRTAGVLS